MRAGSRPLRRNRRVPRRVSPLERRVARGYDRAVLYGRDPERARLGALLEAALASRSGVLVVRGDPGIGKSALLADLHERAGEMHVLAASGVESESELPFSALHQLLRPALGRLDRIPVPQATALRGALGLDDGAREERFLVFAACLSLLSELAEERPVLCLVDDAHWLDAASAKALRFVARRLDAEGIAIVFAVRIGEGRPLEIAGVPSLDLVGLDAEAAAAVLARRAGVVAATGVRDRLLALTGGNALALVELSSTLSPAQLAGREPLADALPLTANVEHAFLERVRRLPAPTQRFLLVAAADDSGTASAVLRAAEALDAGTAALDSAEEAGLVSVRGAKLEFRHPLVRSAVYQAARSSERRGAHRALAEAFGGEDPDRRVWHLAAATVGPDEGIACRLEEAAGHAQERGGYEAAASALERAAEFSAGEAARGRRLVEAARAAMFPGPNDRAVELGQRALPLVDEPLLRAEVARVLGVEKTIRGRRLEGQRVLVDAASEILPVDPGTALQLLVPSILASTDGGEVGALLEGCDLAASANPPAEDESATFFRQILTGIGAVCRGDSARGTPVIEQALDWAITSDDL
jgi:AAA ATPase domain